VTDQASPSDVLAQFVDFLLPLLTPYEGTVYLYLLRHSRLEGETEIRIGKRTIAAELGQGSRASRSNFGHISELLRNLETKGCLAIGETRRDGTLYSVRLPLEVPAARERMGAIRVAEVSRDYYEDAALRRELFERDRWTCQYCGDAVTAETATLDHYVPKSKRGGNDPENLRTCCLMCNSIKSGRTYNEVAPLLLASLRERRARRSDSN
jgi:hypothetical protein